MADRYVDYMPLDQIELAPRNPKLHDTEGIARSVGHFGLAELPLLDDRTGRLVAGHGRYQQLTTMRSDGKEPPDGVRVDEAGRWLMPVVRGWSSRSDDDAEAYLVASNQLTIGGGWDDHALAEMLTDLADAQLLELTGHTTDALDDLLAVLDETGAAQAHSGGGVAGNQSTTLDERYTAYEQAGNHVVILAYPNNVYRWVVEQLGKVAADRGLDSNADTVAALIADVTGETPPEPEPGDDAE